MSTDNETRPSMRLVYKRFKFVCEPGSVAGLAAILNRKIETKGLQRRQKSLC